jgi:hypothetical protein
MQDKTKQTIKNVKKSNSKKVQSEWQCYIRVVPSSMDGWSMWL